jgi:hypothetical protein
MKLVNTHTGNPLVTIEKGTVQFHHSMLADEMELFGVTIPVYLRPQFNNKPRVYPDDPDFERAFRDVYYTHNIDRDVYVFL